MLNLKEEYGSPQWFIEQMATPSGSTITTASSCNSYSPLNDYPIAGYFFQPEEEELISISSLQNGAGGGGGYADMAADDSEELFPDFSVYQQQQQQLQQPEAGQQLSSVSPTYNEQEEQEAVLLESVVRTKFNEIAQVLEVDVGEPASSVSPALPATTAMRAPQLQSTQMSSPTATRMRPPPPVPSAQGFFPTPIPDSLPTIRSFDFQQPIQPIQAPLAFGAWNPQPSTTEATTTMASQAAHSWMGGVQLVPALTLPTLQPQRPPQPQVVQAQDPQVQLVQLLILCAQKVAMDDMETARVILAGLKQLTSPEGTPMERLASYFAEALEARIERNTTSSVFKGLVSDNVLDSKDGTQTAMLEAFSAFYDFLPIGKFDHLTMNQVILDAVEREKAIHILDLHLWIGTQWPAFLHALATRPNGPPRVRITAVGSSERDLKETGRKLLDCAQALKVHLDYNHLTLSSLLHDFRAEMVPLRPGEAFIVNSLSKFHYLLAEETPGTRPSNFSKFLYEIRRLAPKVLVMAENDANHNSPTFLNRFGECLKYYSAVFDAMATLQNSPVGRGRMERLFAAPKIRNIVACDGAERVERHESMSDWVRRLEDVGFRPHPLSQRAVNQAKLLLRLYYTNGYTLKSERGYLILGWRNLPLNTVSAWRT